MCLTQIDYTLMDKLPDKIKAWKVLVVRTNNKGKKILKSDCEAWPYKIGVNICKTYRKYDNDYVPRFHVFKLKKDAISWSCKGNKIVPVYINKKDVTVTGIHNIYDNRHGGRRDVVVIVTKKLTIKREDYKKALE